LNWWLSENPKGRHIWPGSTLSGLGKGGPNPWTSEDILQQFSFARRSSPNPGHVIWNFNRILADQSGIRTALAQRFYTDPAAPPAFTWLDAKPPQKPQIATRAEPNLKTTVQWAASDPERAWLWALQTRTGKDWTTEIIPGS